MRIIAKKHFIALITIATFTLTTIKLNAQYDEFQLYQRFQPIQADNAMVSSQEALATHVGLDILKQGGNAIDAAVAVGYALAVTLPEAGNIGGGGFMLIYLAKEHKVLAINYRETAPLLAFKDMFLDEEYQYDPIKARMSLLSTGVPGTVAGLNLALKEFGTMPLPQVMSGAIELAEKGFAVYPDLAYTLKTAQDLLIKSPEAKKIFFDDQGQPLQAGQILVQSDLAHSLKRIAQHGSNAFYTGEIAQQLVADMEQYGGLISLADLKNYHAEIVEPISATFSNYTVYSMPPPSSGGVILVALLNILHSYPLKEWGLNSARSIHVMTEAMNLVYADRADYMGDPKFVEVPVAKFLSPTYAEKQRARINLDKHTPASSIRAIQWLNDESGDTTHFSITDSQGNMVSNTYTLNSYFGNGHVATNTGILLNNEMDDFSAKPGTPNLFGLIGNEANAIAPLKQPLSSMTPTIVIGHTPALTLATGTPGGSRIITTVAQIILNVFEHQLDIASATAAPRIHSQWLPDELRIEQGFSQDTLALLKSMGHHIALKQVMGTVNSVIHLGDRTLGAADPRTPSAQAVGF